MASRYNGLCDSERMAVVALRARMELKQGDEDTDSRLHSPESELKQVINDAGLSGKGILDERKILSAYYGHR